MIFEKIHIIIGIVILALVTGGYMLFDGTDEDVLTVYVNGIEQDDSKMLEVTGDSSKYRVSPGETVTITAEVYNKNEHPDGAYYKVWIYQITDFNTRFVMLETDEVFLSNYDFKVWSGTYKTLTVPSTVTIYVESGTRPTLISTYDFNDIDHFDIVVEAPPTPTPTPTPTPSPTATPTPTPSPSPTPEPDLCDGVTCNPYCDGTTYFYNGYCDVGECIYQAEYNSGQCMTPTPTPTPTETGTVTPTPTETPPPEDDDEADTTGIVLWGLGIIGVLLILLISLKAKR